jgi:hypothetical protein
MIAILFYVKVKAVVHSLPLSFHLRSIDRDKANAPFPFHIRHWLSLAVLYIHFLSAKVDCRKRTQRHVNIQALLL